ncbi:MAG: hypothetical protein F6K47_30250 [Symploca sp. SIO2E6]|nr:hypothetical protein [Symploca sp. SIO2E6]
MYHITAKTAVSEQDAISEQDARTTVVVASLERIAITCLFPIIHYCRGTG